MSDQKAQFSFILLQVMNQSKVRKEEALVGNSRITLRIHCAQLLEQLGNPCFDSREKKQAPMKKEGDPQFPHTAARKERKKME